MTTLPGLDSPAWTLIRATADTLAPEYLAMLLTGETPNPAPNGGHWPLRSPTVRYDSRGVHCVGIAATWDQILTELQERIEVTEELSDAYALAIDATTVYRDATPDVRHLTRHSIRRDRIAEEALAATRHARALLVAAIEAAS